LTVGKATKIEENTCPAGVYILQGSVLKDRAIGTSPYKISIRFGIFSKKYFSP